VLGVTKCMNLRGCLERLLLVPLCHAAWSCLDLGLTGLGGSFVVLVQIEVLALILLRNFSLLAEFRWLALVILGSLLGLRVEELRIGPLKPSQYLSSVFCPRKLSRVLLDSLKDALSKLVVLDCSDYSLEDVIAELVEDQLVHDKGQSMRFASCLGPQLHDNAIIIFVTSPFQEGIHLAQVLPTFKALLDHIGREFKLTESDEVFDYCLKDRGASLGVV